MGVNTEVRVNGFTIPFFYGQEQSIFIPVCCHLTAIVSFYIGFKWVIGPNSSTGLWGARQYKEPYNSELVKYSLSQGFREDFRKWNFWAVKYNSQFIAFSVICHSLKIYLQIRCWYLVGSTRLKISLPFSNSQILTLFCKHLEFVSLIMLLHDIMNQVG